MSRYECTDKAWRFLFAWGYDKDFGYFVQIYDLDRTAQVPIVEETHLYKRDILRWATLYDVRDTVSKQMEKKKK